MTKNLTNLSVSSNELEELPELIGNLENLQELDGDEDLYESIEDIWPDYPTKEDFLFNEDEY